MDHSVFYNAAEQNDVATLRMFAQKYAGQINKTTKLAAIHIACIKDNLEAVNLLYQHECFLLLQTVITMRNCRLAKKSDPFSISVANRSKRVMEYFISKRTKMSANDDGLTALHFMIFTEQTVCIKHMISQNYIDTSMNYYEFAHMLGNPAIIELFKMPKSLNDKFMKNIRKYFVFQTKRSALNIEDNGEELVLVDIYEARRQVPKLPELQPKDPVISEDLLVPKPSVKHRQQLQQMKAILSQEEPKHRLSCADSHTVFQEPQLIKDVDQTGNMNLTIANQSSKSQKKLIKVKVKKRRMKDSQKTAIQSKVTSQLTTNKQKSNFFNTQRVNELKIIFRDEEVELVEPAGDFEMSDFSANHSFCSQPGQDKELSNSDESYYYYYSD